MADSPNLLQPRPDKWWEEEPFGPPTPKRRHGRWILIVTALLLFVASATYAGHRVFVAVSLDDNTFGPPKTFVGKVKQFLSSDDRRIKGETDDRINILLLGMGGVGHEGPYLTDTMIIVSIKPSTRQVAMTSIPRDLIVNIPGYGLRKVNNANAFGEADEPGSGAQKAAEVVSTAFNQPIPYFVRADFAGFEKLIDLIGGIDVEVERTFTDPTFPAIVNGTSTVRTVTFEKGARHMDGEAALDFVRSRHGTNGEGSDFARSKRQQKVLLAIKEKILSPGTLLNPLRLGGLVDMFQKYVATNLSTTDMLRFARYASDFTASEVRHLTLNDGPGGLLQSGIYEGAYILEPTSGNFEEIRSRFYNVFGDGEVAAPAGATAGRGDGATTPPVAIEIQNGTWRPGLAAQVQKDLEGAAIVTNGTRAIIGNSVKKPVEQTVIYDKTNGQHPELTKKLAAIVHAPVLTIPPPWFQTATSSPMEAGTDILILIGTDYLTYDSAPRPTL